MSSHPEDELARQFQRDGSRDAFDQLCALLLPPIRRHLLVLTRGDSFDCDELQQEVLLALFRALKTFRFESRFTTFVWSLTQHVAVGHLRRWGRRRRREDRAHRLGAPLVPVTDPVSEVENAWRVDDVRRALDSLSDKERSLLHLRELEGLSHEELSRVFRVPVGTIKSRLARARAALARVLQSEVSHG